MERRDDGLRAFASSDAALQALETALVADAPARARDAGAVDLRITVERDIRQVEIEGRQMFIEARLTSSGGAVLCSGVMKFNGFSATFKATCFDKFVFAGPVPETAGYAMYEGQFVQRLTMTANHGKSYISIKPRI